MYKPAQEVTQPRVSIIVTEVELLRPSPRLLLRRRKPQPWWNEERLALLALTVGNVCFLALVLWWLW
jgi:hypothetical protein